MNTKDLIYLTIILVLIITVLKQLDKTIPETKQAKGRRGEKETQRMLEKIKGKKWFLKNLYLKNEKGKTSEIDLLMLHTSGIYVIECKNYSGWIFGNENDYKWCQIIGKFRRRFYNPIKQNQTHIKSLINAMGDEPIKTKIIFNVIAFSDKTKLKKVFVTNKSTYVTVWTRLPEVLKERTDREIYKEEVLEEVYQKLLPYSRISKKEREKHIENIKEKYRDSEWYKK